MAELTYNEQLLHKAAGILGYRGEKGDAPRDVYGMLSNIAKDTVERLLTYKGADGKAARDFYGMLANLPQDAAKALLNTKLRSVHDGQEYTFEQYLVTDNQRLNEARIKDAARDAQIATLVDTVKALAQGQALDVDDLLARTQAAAEAGVAAAIDSIETTTTVNVKESK